MLNSLNKYFITNKYHIALNIVAAIAVVYYFIQNWHNDALGFLVVAYAKFLLFTNLYYILMFFRYRFYKSIKELVIVRISEEKYYESIIKYESLVMLVYYILIYVIGAFILGTNYLLQYIVMVGIFGLFLILTQIIHFIALLWKKNVYISFCITYILFAIYTYGLFDRLNEMIFA